MHRFSSPPVITSPDRNSSRDNVQKKNVLFSVIKERLSARPSLWEAGYARVDPVKKVRMALYVEPSLK